MQHFFLITFQTQTVTIATAEITATANTTNTAMSATEKKSYISNSSDMSWDYMIIRYYVLKTICREIDI